MNERVLVVDDEEDLLKTMEVALNNEGYQVKCSQTGNDAIGFFKDKPFDIVITDIKMPGMNGVDVLNKVKELDKFVEVIILTGFSTVENTIETLKNDKAFDYLTKPLENIDDLYLSVEKALERRKLRKQQDTLLLELKERQLELERQNQELCRSKEMLSQKEAQLQAILDYSPALISIRDLDGNIILANNQFNILDGPPPEEYVGKNVSTVFPKNFADVLRENDHETLKKKKPVVTEEIVRHKDGSWHTYLTVRFPLYNHEDITYGTCSISTDITHRKQVENNLYKSEERLKEAQRIGKMGSWEYDIKTQRITWSDQAFQLFGNEPPPDPTNLGEIHKYYPDDAALLHNAIHRAKENGESFKQDLHLKLYSGHSAYHSFTVYPIQDPKGLVEKLIGTVQDITERKKMEDELIKAKKLEATGILAGGIAHDFNNLLYVILGYIDLSNEEIENDHKITSLLAEAKKAAVRAKDLTQKFITFSSGGDPVKSMISIDSLIVEVKDIVFSGSNVQCDCSFSDQLWQAEVDKGQIHHVLANIFENAKHAMPDGGILKIIAENTMHDIENKKFGLNLNNGKYVKIIISDDGIGISKYNLEKIFDPYFSTKEKGIQKGMGLGLSIAHSILNKHKGYIHITSELGSGTEVYMFIPSLVRSASKQAEEPESLPDFSKRILVMDDEEQIRTMSKLILNRLGYDVVLASHGEEAIQLYRDCLESGQPFDAVILDLTVKGGMGGKQAMKNLLLIDPHVKAIIVSGYTEHATMSSFEEHGFITALNKPLSMNQLKKTIGKILFARSDIPD